LTLVAGLFEQRIEVATALFDAWSDTELAGRRWTVEGMSYLIFDGLTVVREADYHDGGSRERSLRSG
jgi:hypothetical protein